MMDFSKLIEQQRRYSLQRWRDGHLTAPLKQRARKLGLEMNLSAEDIRELRKLPCLYCHQDGGTIDRVNNERGYLIDNCVPACRSCNSSKQTEKFMLGRAN